MILFDVLDGLLYFCVSHFQDSFGQRRSSNKKKAPPPLEVNHQSVLGGGIGDTFNESNNFVSRGVQCD